MEELANTVLWDDDFLMEVDHPAIMAFMRIEQDYYNDTTVLADATNMFPTMEPAKSYIYETSAAHGLRSSPRPPQQ